MPEMTDETRQQITDHLANGDNAESCPICFRWLRALLAQVKALEAERDELRDRDRVLSRQLELRSQGRDALTQELMADRDRLAALVERAWTAGQAWDSWETFKEREGL